MARSGREALTVGREWLVGPPGGPEWSRGPHEGLGVVGRLSWRTGMVQRLTRRAGRGQEVLLVGRERSRGPPGWSEGPPG